MVTSSAASALWMTAFGFLDMRTEIVLSYMSSLGVKSINRAETADNPN